MDSGNGQDLSQLLRVLAQGQEKTRQLEARLDDPSAAEVCKSLAQQIESTFHAAISMMAEGSQQQQQQQLAWADSPPFAGDSPRSEGSDRVFRDHERMEMSKKSMPRWNRKVRECSAGGGVEGPLVDGYSWRKYGQKDILGTNYPRGYFRCTHRNSKGCLATKQVQRSDEDPSIFNITYRGLHTCTQIFQAVDNLQENIEVDQPNDELLQQLQSLRTELEVKTEDINFSPTFVSAPTTLEPNYYFSLTSQCQISNYGGGGPSLGAQQTEHAAEASSTAATSMGNSPMADVDFVLRQAEEYGPNFF